MNSILGSKTLTQILFAIYLISLVWIIVFKFNVQWSYMGGTSTVNWIPYSQPVLHNGQADHNESILNILIFIPFGLYAGILFKKWNFGKALGLFFSGSFILELWQFVFKIGSFDTTDLINNTLGGIFGFYLFQGFQKLLGNPEKARKWVNLICLLGTVLILGLLFFLKINRLYMFRK